MCDPFTLIQSDMPNTFRRMCAGSLLKMKNSSFLLGYPQQSLCFHFIIVFVLRCFTSAESGTKSQSCSPESGPSAHHVCVDCYIYSLFISILFQNSPVPIVFHKISYMCSLESIDSLPHGSCCNHSARCSTTFPAYVLYTALLFRLVFALNPLGFVTAGHVLLLP